MTDDYEEKRLKEGLLRIYLNIAEMRRDIASLQEDGMTHFLSIADRLDAIIESTEEASNSILDSMESIEQKLETLRGLGDPKVAELCAEIQQDANRVFVACSFQDLTGQRITRVIESLKFVEERVNILVRSWGKEEITKAAEALRGQSMQDDQSLLNGPQRNGFAIRQDDIDKLFQ